MVSGRQATSVATFNIYTMNRAGPVLKTLSTLPAATRYEPISIGHDWARCTCPDTR